MLDEGGRRADCGTERYSLNHAAKAFSIHVGTDTKAHTFVFLAGGHTRKIGISIDTFDGIG